ncbi:MAG: pyridoxal phosphate-dependent aminotransferase [Pseudomonadota bacterium]|nr:pyridoxal phosphate-dependent aminotransferase [Pseudomonadota bacterium]
MNAMDLPEYRIAHRVADARISAIKEMAMLSARIEGAASLTWGLPSFQTPEWIREAVAGSLAIDPDIGKYALPDGLPVLRQLAAERHARETGISVDVDHHVMITAGNMQALNTLFHVLINPGDEIILTDPGFASHFQQVQICGGLSVHWALDEANGWRLNVDALPQLITPRSKAIVLVSPSNPTGAIFERESLLRVGEIARAHNLLVILDDPYSAFTYEHREEYFNLASVPALRERVIYCFTFSKCYAMSGWRLGYMILPSALKREALKVHDATMICAPRISQVAGVAALRHDIDPFEEFEAVLARRRALICERLDHMSHVFRYSRPQGAYYVFPRIVAPHQDAWEFCRRLLEEASVTLTPGSAFGPSGEHHVRMAYCVSDDTINQAFDRMERYFGREGR